MADSILTQQSVSSRGHSGLSSLLSEALECVERRGHAFVTIRSQLLDLQGRLEKGRYHLAVLGQFKRGKSTLLNALLGEEILPVSVIPLTAIPTFLEYGRQLQVTVRFQDGRAPDVFDVMRAQDIKPFLLRYVTESENPENRLGVSHVTVSLPAPILENGVVFIDTPGIGSTFRHNTEAALNFLPQCDSALFLVSADPPITEVEIEFLRRVREKIPRLFFILNKVDYLSPDDRKAALEFMQRMLVEQAGIKPPTTVFCVSAKQGLDARRSDDPLLWKESGLEAVERHLVGFLIGEKENALRDAVGRKAVDLIANVLMRLRLERQSLEMPLNELEHRLGVLERSIDEVRLLRQSAGDILSGDSKRMIAFLEEHAAHLRTNARDYLDGVIKEALTRNDGRNISEEVIQSAVAEAIPGWFEHQLGATSALFHERTAEVLRLHQERADRLIEVIRRKAADLFDIPYHAPESSRAFEMVRKPYWETHQWHQTITPIPKGVVDGFLPASMRRIRIIRRVNEQLDELIVSNVENLRWAMYQSIAETFRCFGSTFDERLADVLDATQGAIRAAMGERAKLGDAVGHEAARLHQAISDLVAIQKALQAA